MIEPKEVAVIVFTSHRGVFFGYTSFPSGDVVTLSRCRMAIRWGTSRGVLELADTGPTERSKLSAQVAVMEIRHVTAFATVSEQALARWERAS